MRPYGSAVAKHQTVVHRRYDDRPERAGDLGILAVCNNINGPISDEAHLTSDDTAVTCGRCIRIRESIPKPESLKPFSTADLRRISRDLGDPSKLAAGDTTRMPSNPKDSPWYSTPNDARKRKPIGITLSPEALDRLERMAKARKLSRSQVVEDLIMTTHIRPPKEEHTDG